MTSRNVPNDILSRLGTTKDKRDGVVMVNFAPYFVAESGEATVKRVADHIEEIGKVAGRRQ
jgi:membrane dipeptidase